MVQGGILCFSSIVLPQNDILLRGLFLYMIDCKMKKNSKYGEKMSCCTVLFVPGELNESLRKIAFGHKNNELHMHRSNHVSINCFVSLDLCIRKKPEKVISLSVVALPNGVTLS